MGSLGRWTLAAHPSSAGEARRLVAAVCESFGREAVEVVTLLTSELVGNAALHGSGPVQLAVTAAGDAVHVEVQDRSLELPQARAAGHLDDSGRGLMLVEHLASAWGVARCDVPSGKRVWFDVPINNPVAAV